MSGVLERMAKRVLGALPTVQPLAAQQFASPQSGLHESGGLQETILEVDTMMHPRERTQHTTQQAQKDQDRIDKNDELDDYSWIPPKVKAEETKTQDASMQKMEMQESEAADFSTPKMEKRKSKLQEILTQTTREHEYRRQDHTPDQIQPRESVRPFEQTVQGKPESEDRETLHQAKVNAKKTMWEPEQRGDHAAQSTKVEAPEEQEFKPRALMIDRRAESDSQSAENKSVKAEVAIESAPRREKKIVPVAQQGNSPVVPLPQTISQQTRPAEQKTEIHISIGSIELRAPRQEARSQPAPFQPRVTLEQFLHRKPEAGR